ncbi:MAG: cyclic nucleotide-binding domain-containing protein [Thermodesulfobacteriota bacterium]|nr:cyclic nucleotide-binding domain-containing protein [Thermodesulfobacteriota bacterium]
MDLDAVRIRTIIEGCELFRGFDGSQIGILIKNADIKRFSEGVIVYAKGEESQNTFCLIVSGSVNIVSDNGFVLEELGRNQIIGEIGTISPQHRRTVDVVAKEPTEVLEWNFLDIKESLPDLLKRLKDLAWKRISNWIG